jgi:hypothetical protein
LFVERIRNFFYGFPKKEGTMKKIFTAIMMILTFAFLMMLPISRAYAINPVTLPQVGYHPGSINYWSTPYFANALSMGDGWLEHAPWEWGTAVDLWNNPQFDTNGYPQYLNSGLELRAIIYPLHANYSDLRPNTWPRRSLPAEGHVVLTWHGRADIRLGGGTYLSDESSGPSTGILLNGRRVYLFDGVNGWINVYAIDPGNPITDIKVWLPDPVDPMNQSLEGQLFHPIFLQRLTDADWGFIRFMNFQQTNANPQQDWSDRRPPSHMNMSGVLNPRSPSAGFPGGRGSGIAFEHMVSLANSANKDLWICIPHLANEDFIRKLAQLIRFGSDGLNPYPNPVGAPVYSPLNSELRIYIEYSNEIWSGGNGFPQGNWAQDQADTLGISRAQYNARRFCDVWRIFQEVFDGSERLVRVAAIFTAAQWYTQPFLNEINVYGPTLNPAVEPDVIAVTTYFGNGIQDWVFEKALSRVEATDPWFLTGETFNPGNGEMRPVSLPADDPYWTGPGFADHQNQAFAEWQRRLLSGATQEGGGPDAVGLGGGFDIWVRDLARTVFPEPKPIIAYEGGPSIYTNNRDWGDSRDDGITIFMEAMNRHSVMADVYSIHLNMAKSKGLWTHVMFVDSSFWGRYGQWGHLEHLDQDPAESVKYKFILDWIDAMAGLRHIDQPLDNVPQFNTDHQLPIAVVGQPYTAHIDVSGGDGGRAITPVGQLLADGLQFNPVIPDPDRVTITGIPYDGGLSYLYLRVMDADGDPAWRIFTLRTIGGPNTLVETDFRGTNPAQNLPWMPTYVLADDLAYSGWNRGTGVFSEDGDNSFVWSLNMPADEAYATLALAVAEDEYLAMSVQPYPGFLLNLRNAEIRFTIRRVDWHAPRRYAVFTSIEGFADGSQVFTSHHTYDVGTHLEFVFSLPDTTAYNTVSGPVEFRLYGFRGQYGGHKTSLTDFKLNGQMIGKKMRLPKEKFK